MKTAMKPITATVAILLLAAPLAASAQRCRGPSRAARHHRDVGIAVGALATGVVLGHVIQGSTVHHTREVYYMPACPPPVYYAPPPPRPVVVHSGYGRRLYQPPVPGHPAFIQVWDGCGWRSVGTHPAVY